MSKLLLLDCNSNLNYYYNYCYCSYNFFLKVCGSINRFFTLYVKVYLKHSGQCKTYFTCIRLYKGIFFIYFFLEKNKEIKKRNLRRFN